MLPVAFTQAIQSESDRAFMENIFRQYQRKMEEAVTCYCRDGQSREDVFQSACVGLVGHVDRLKALAENPDAVAAYIWITVRNCARNCYKKEQRHHKHRVCWEDAEPFPGSGDLARAVEQREDTRSALSQLKDRDRMLLYCRYCFGMDNRETAKLVGVNPKSVGVYIQRAKEKALALLKKREGQV